MNAAGYVAGYERTRGIDDAVEQGVEADEAGQTMELRSLTPVFGGLAEMPPEANK